LKNILSSLIIALFTAATHAQIPKTLRLLPDTGQTQDFTTTQGEDSDFTINPPFFTQNNDETVTDTITSLMWQSTDGGEMTIENAVIYCENLTLGGHDNWRLPTAQEAFSILNHQKVNPAMDITYFPNTGAQYWWTSEKQANDATKIWATNAGGGIGNHPKSETISAGGTKKFHARAVRDVQTPPTVAAQYWNGGNGIVITDLLTGLDWQRFAIADSMTWENALIYAENLTLDGHDDWRLPNIKELQSINNETMNNPSVDFLFFQGIGVKKYWSSTSLPNQPTRAWYMHTRFGITTYDPKTAKNNLVCVRNGLNGATKTTDLLVDKTPILVFPNPFVDFISLNNAPENAVFEMTNALGQVVFLGKNLEKQDFSRLPVGVYYLRISGGKELVFRIVKN
jgi:Protein of unknown function (DUF1566)